MNLALKFHGTPPRAPTESAPRWVPLVILRILSSPPFRAAPRKAHKMLTQSDINQIFRSRRYRGENFQNASARLCATLRKKCCSSRAGSHVRRRPFGVAWLWLVTTVRKPSPSLFCAEFKQSSCFWLSSLIRHSVSQLRTWLHSTCKKMNSITKELPVLLTLNEAAARLSVSRRTLEREISSGRFPKPIKIGRSTRVPTFCLTEYVARLSRPEGAR